MNLAALLDSALDRAIVPGYTRIGPLVRRRWWPDDPKPGSMAGKHVLATGASSGIGKATAAGLARLGAHVHVHGRNHGHVDEAIEELQTAVPGGEFEQELCDVSDLSDVRRFCADFAERVPVLSALLHNAGTMAHERTETKEGHEITLAAHVLGPHLMTSLLRGPLKAAGGASVLFMSRAGCTPPRCVTTTRSTSPAPTQGPRPMHRRSGCRSSSRTCGRTGSRPHNIRVESMHPGWVNTKGVATYLPKFRAITLPLMRPAEEGADTAVWLVATRPDSSGSEHFWHERRLRPTSYGRERDQGAAKRQRLWDYVAKATETV